MGEKYKTWDQAGGKESSKKKNVRLKSDFVMIWDPLNVVCVNVGIPVTVII
jgi:hypothetical protein